jgi:hypothetical protein
MLLPTSTHPRSSRQAVDQGMAKLLQFRRPDDGTEVEFPSSSANAPLDMPALISRIGSFRTKAKEDIRTMILMFDVALMHGRLAIPNVEDQEARRRLEAHLQAIEEMLDLARVKALRL